MSFNRAKANEYGNSRRNMFSGTSSQFGRVGRNIDRESEKPKLATEKFVERPRAEQDEQPSTSDKVRDEMDKLEEDKEKETDKSDFKSDKSPPTVRKAPLFTSDELVSKYEPGGAFIKMWTSVDHISIPPVIKPMKSSYMPNFIMGSIIIRSLEDCLDGNEELKWICPFYFSLPVRLYYTVIFYLQILKAKESVKKIGKTESTWFRAFKRSFPLESLPVVGPMVPFLSNIVSVKPNDDKYDYIYPEFTTNGGLRVEKGVPLVSPIFFIQPNVLIQAEFLRQYCNLTNAQLVGQTNNTDDYFDDQLSLVPHRIGSIFNFAGIDFPAQLTVPTSMALSNVAMDHFLPEAKARCIEIHPYWQRSKAAGIPATQTTNEYSNIGEAMRMTEDFEWFESCVYMATIQCKFFTHSTNMSQIPTTGGSEVLVSAHITGQNAQYVGAEAWYPRNWRNLKSTFQTTRADTGPDQFLNAELALTTGTISWLDNGHPIGGRQIGHRVGPYWDNREFEYKLETPIEVGRRITTTIQSQFYDREGKAS
jgi:hypothetical protein